MNKEEQIERIDRYLTKQMTDEEVAAFEGELATNKELSSLLESTQLADKLLTASKDFGIKDMVHSIADQYDVESPDTDNSISSIKELAPSISEKKEDYSFWRRYRIAASVIILFLGTAVVLMMTSRTTDFETLASEYFEPYEGTITLGGNDTAAVDLRKKIMAHYQKQEYTKVIEGLTESQFKDDAKAQFYLGIAYLAEDNYTQALVIFEKLNQLDFEYSKDVKINLALSYLGENKQNEAIQLLKEIIEIGPSDNGFPRAKLILAEIE